MIPSCCNPNNAEPPAARHGMLECPVCGLCRQLEPPSDSELERIYSEAYYASWGENAGYEAYWEMKRRLAHKLLSAIPGTASRCSVLDLGCATGPCLSAIVERGWDAHGVDINPYAVEAARRRVPGATVTRGDLGSLGHASEIHDAVILSDVLEHFRNPRQQLRHVHRLLKPGGLAVILTPDTGSLSRRIMGRSWPHFKKEHLYLFSRPSLRGLLESSGFGILSITAMSKPITLEYAATQLQVYPLPGVSPLSRLMSRVLPGAVQRAVLPLFMGEMCCVARKDR